MASSASGNFVRKFSQVNIADDDATPPPPRYEDGFRYMSYSETLPGPLKRRREVTRVVSYVFSKPIFVLDPWDIGLKLSRDAVSMQRTPCLDAWKLRETQPDHIPVCVDKDPSSDVPDIEVKKCHVPGDLILEEFFEFLSPMGGRHPPLYLSFKKTVPVAGALMSAVDEKNRDEEDGFLHVTYSGVQNGRAWACVSPDEF